MGKIAKTFTVILILIVVISSAVMLIVKPVNAQSGTSVSGVINQDATWTQANSPYIFTGNVLVNNGVTLTIEAGATVNFVGYYMEINGTLIAKGTNTSPINVTGGVFGIGDFIFTQYSKINSNLVS